MAVTVSITVMCQLAVRHTCVCSALPINPVDRSRGRPFHQSQKPVIAVASERIAPAMMTNVAARERSCATVLAESPLAATNEMTSKTAAST